MSESTDQPLRKLVDQLEHRNEDGCLESELMIPTKSKAWTFALLIPAIFSIAIHFSFSKSLAANPRFWLLLCAASGALAVLSFIAYRPALSKSLKPKQGDLSLGFALAVLLILVCIAGRTLFAQASSEQHAWLLRIFLQVGPAKALEANPLILTQLMAIVIAEEVIFRGAVFLAWEQIMGRRGWIFASLMYALALSPTIYQLKVDEAGLNPLLFLAAIVAGLVWCFARKISGRMGPGVVAHLIFTYFMLTQLRPPGL